MRVLYSVVHSCHATLVTLQDLCQLHAHPVEQYIKLSCLKGCPCRDRHGSEEGPLPPRPHPEPVGQRHRVEGGLVRRGQGVEIHPGGSMLEKVAGKFIYCLP